VAATLCTNEQGSSNCAPQIHVSLNCSSNLPVRFPLKNCRHCICLSCCCCCMPILSFERSMIRVDRGPAAEEREPPSTPLRSERRHATYTHIRACSVSSQSMWIEWDWMSLKPKQVKPLLIFFQSHPIHVFWE
jgi:hypothetical protein